MEIKTENQYTYFIYPYIVEEKKYEKHLYKLLTNSKCKIKKFDRDDDARIQNFFLPKVKDYMFWNIGLNKAKIKKLNEFDTKMQSAMLNKYACTIFFFFFWNDIQGKVGQGGGIFFNIKKIEIICFKPGICFMLIKTKLVGDNNLEELCTFNERFRDINSSKSDENQSENIKVQADEFQDIKGFQNFIKDITGNNKGARELNIDTERFITYSYACTEKEAWNQEEIKQEFQKFANIVGSEITAKSDIKNIELDSNAKLGFTKNGTVLLTSDISKDSTKSLAKKYENEYLYCYIYELFRKYYLKKLNQEFKTQYQFEKTKIKFMDFTQNLMIEEITDNTIGEEIIEKWEEMINVKEIFFQTKQKYDLLYKNSNIEKTAQSNKVIAVILAILVIINIINSFNLFR